MNHTRQMIAAKQQRDGKKTSALRKRKERTSDAQTAIDLDDWNFPFSNVTILVRLRKLAACFCRSELKVLLDILHVEDIASVSKRFGLLCWKRSHSRLNIRILWYFVVFFSCVLTCATF